MSPEESTQELLAALALHLEQLGYKRRTTDHALAAWTRKRAFTNRALVVLELPDGQVPKEQLRRVRKALRKELGYIPLLYGLYSQVIFVGNETGDMDDMDASVDKIDTQTFTVQVAHLCDPATRSVRSAQTWGQFISGGLHEALRTVLAEWTARGR